MPEKISRPIVTVFIVTYDRPREIRLTIDALSANLRYPPDRLRWHLADDGTPGAYLDDLKRDYSALNFSATVTERKGWGANVNKGMQHCWEENGSYIFLCEDDYVALKPLDLERGVMLLETTPTVGLVRYDGLSAHSLNLLLREADTPLGRFDFLSIEKSSPHLNIYSNRPHLKHRRFHEAYGQYPEGLSLSDTEVTFAHHVRDVVGPTIAALGDGIERAFDHIGKSRQGSEHDQAT
jgi:hypothetical protein